MSTGKNITMGIASAVLVLSLTPQAAAQEAPPWISIMTTKIKPEMRAEYEGYVKQIGAAYKKGGAAFYVVYQNFSGDLTEYISVLPVLKFADFDGPPLLQKVLGEEGWANLSKNIQRCITSQVRTFNRTLPELGIQLTGGQMSSNVWMHSVYAITPGKMTEYQDWMKKDYKPALEKIGVKMLLVSTPTFGGGVNQIDTMRMMKNMAEIDEGPLLQKLGREQANALTGKVEGISRIMSRRLVRIRPDLSQMMTMAPPKAD